MKNFKKGGFSKGGSFGDRPKFGGDRKFGAKPFGDRRGGDKPARSEFFSAVCSSCGKDCEVPFRPTGERPVFCRDCFGKKDREGGQRFEPRGGSDRFERSDRPAPSREFRPAAQHMPAERMGGNDDLKKQIANLEYKLDRVLKLLSQNTPAKTFESREVKAEVTAPAVPAVITKKAKPAAKKAKPSPKKTKK